MTAPKTDQEEQPSYKTEPLYSHLVPDVEEDDTSPGMTQREVDDLLDARPTGTRGEEGSRG